MAGLWETLPASPCSAASDETAVRAAPKHGPVSPQAPTKAQVLLNTLPATPNNTSFMSATPVSSHCVPSSPPVAKRARVELSPRTTRPMDLDLDKPASPDTVSDLPASLSEEDLVEKRRALLERLRIIESKKAKLVSSPPPDDEVTVVEASTAPPRPTARSRRPSGKKASKAAPPANAVIDLDDISLDIASLAPKKKATKRKYSAPRGPASKSIDLDLVEMSKRKSSRVRRPRTPNLLDDKPNKTGPIPTCMSKCKRVQFCKKLIVSMLRDDDAKPFSAPVKELWHEQAIPKYFEIITKPMDLGTVKKNLETTKYIRSVSGDALPYRFDVDHFADDVRLVFRNAMVYNRAGDFIHNSAHSLLEEFEKQLDTLPPLPHPETNVRSAPKKKTAPSRSEKTVEAPKPRQRKSTDPSRSSGSLKVKKARETRAVEDSGDADLEGLSVKELRDRLRYLQRCRTPVLARTPVPKGSGYLSKAALLYDVEMTWQERKKCMESSNRVPASKMESFVEMVMKTSNMSSSDDSDEFELDFDSLDNKSLRNIEAFLEQYVPGFKTVRSSTIGREFADVELVESEIQRVRDRLSTVQTESKKESDRSGTNAAPSKSFFSQGEAHESSSDSSDSSSDDDDSDSSDDDSGEDSD